MHPWRRLSDVRPACTSNGKGICPRASPTLSLAAGQALAVISMPHLKRNSKRHRKFQPAPWLSVPCRQQVQTEVAPSVWVLEWKLMEQNDSARAAQSLRLTSCGYKPPRCGVICFCSKADEDRNQTKQKVKAGGILWCITTMLLTEYSARCLWSQRAQSVRDLHYYSSEGCW